MTALPDSLREAVRALVPPATRIDCIETHISWVLLAGDLAFKIKKPVTLPFLDYGTLEKRRACCAQELALNRRFAPDLYLDVVELAGEPAVRMRRFDAALRLDQVSSNGDLNGAHLAQLARDLAAFQDQAAVAPEQFGTPERIRADALENFDELAALLPVESPVLTRLRQWTEAEWQRREADFARRRAAGRVREGHGDLHLGNLVLLDGRVVPFDGIEFNEGFRCIDTANEIAFTLLDLLDHRRPGLASWLLDAWLAASGDFDALAVLRFYLVYRAMVRAKVAALRAQATGAAADAQEAAGYLVLATRLTVAPAPTFTITCGPSGCGKTHASNRRLAVADFLHTVRVRSDVERKRLFGLAPEADSGGAIYTPEATARTYARLAAVAEFAVANGWSVIADAAFLKRAERDAFRALAEKLGVPFAILAPAATPEECARRIAARRGDASEATVAGMEQQLRWLEPLGADEPAQTT
jgi:aminoglycoside phosphotransferase family enzyme/predicted kinase